MKMHFVTSHICIRRRTSMLQNRNWIYFNSRYAYANGSSAIGIYLSLIKLWFDYRSEELHFFSNIQMKVSGEFIFQKNMFRLSFSRSAIHQNIHYSRFKRVLCS